MQFQCQSCLFSLQVDMTTGSHTQCNIWIYSCLNAVYKLSFLQYILSSSPEFNENYKKILINREDFKSGHFSVCLLSIYRDRLWSEVFYSGELPLCVNGTSRPSTEYHHHLRWQVDVFSTTSYTTQQWQLELLILEIKFKSNLILHLWLQVR